MFINIYEPKEYAFRVIKQLNFDYDIYSIQFFDFNNDGLLDILVLDKQDDHFIYNIYYKSDSDDYDYGMVDNGKLTPNFIRIGQS